MLLPSDASRSQKKQKPPKHQAANLSETRFGTFSFRASAIARQGTVASPARLPDLTNIRSLLMLVRIIAASLIGERGAVGIFSAGGCYSSGPRRLAWSLWRRPWKKWHAARSPSRITTANGATAGNVGMPNRWARRSRPTIGCSADVQNGLAVRL